MIYLDNSATTLQKPPEVTAAVTRALSTFGNSGRSFCQPAMLAARSVYEARREVASLVELDNPLDIAFTSGATESLNLVINSLIRPKDHVITSVLEHNSVLRPLYQMGCALSFIPCDRQGRMKLDGLDALLKSNTRFLVCTHGSNLTGAVTDVKVLREFCDMHNLIFILDVSQTLGCIETFAKMADVLCFTGHKALLGPQGTGGIIVNRPLAFGAVKTGGSGSHSFSMSQPQEMPDIFEAGTGNAHGLAGLKEGTAYINRTSVTVIREHEQRLRLAFLSGIEPLPGLRLYSAPQGADAMVLPVVALNLEGFTADELAFKLWENGEIATRSGSHCAPLVHEYFNTRETGMVRFSFSYFNTPDEIDYTTETLRKIAAKRM